MNKIYPSPHINKSLNVIKCLSAFAIVCIHCYLIKDGGSSQILIDGLCRFATPIFFLISGYYSYYENYTKAIPKYKTRSIRLIKLIILSNLLYIMNFDLFKSLISQNFQVVINTISPNFSLNSIYGFLVFNIQIGYHLWFLGALLYCYLFLLILIKVKINPKRLYKYIPLLLLSNLLLGETLHYTGIFITPIEYYRNFLFTGLPFFMLGYFIHDKQNQIIPKISNKKILIFLTIFCCFTILETLTLNFTIDLNIGSIFTSLLLFIWCVKNPNTLDFKIIGWIGGKIYDFIYILHPLILGILTTRFNLKMGIISPILIFSITTIISTVLYFIVKKIKRLLTNIKTTFKS